MSDFPNLSLCLNYGRFSKYVLTINAAFKVTVTIGLVLCIHPLIKMRACRMPVLLKNPHIKNTRDQDHFHLCALYTQNIYHSHRWALSKSLMNE